MKNRIEMFFFLPFSREKIDIIADGLRNETDKTHDGIRVNSNGPVTPYTGISSISVIILLSLTLFLFGRTEFLFIYLFIIRIRTAINRPKRLLLLR